MPHQLRAGTTAATYAEWRGTPEESFALVNALANHCTCRFSSSGARLETCPPHAMLVSDQRALDGLLFMRRLAARLLREEYLAPRTSAPR